MIGIRYVGKKEKHADNHYGTRLTWAPDQVHNVADDVATKMLKHGDVYVEAKPLKQDKSVTPEQDPAGQTLAEQQKIKDQQDDDDRHNSPPLVDLGQLDKARLQDYALRHFNEKLRATMKEETMRNRIATFLNRK